MDRKSKALIIIFVISIIISISFTYQRSFIDRDFSIVQEEIEEEPLEE